jgi:hypothetical protein
MELYQTSGKNLRFSGKEGFNLAEDRKKGE